MKIALIAPPWVPVPPPAYGGTEAVIDVLARGLQRAGHDVTLYAHAESTIPVPVRSVIKSGEPPIIGDGTWELAHTIGAYEQIEDDTIVHDHTRSGPLVNPRVANMAVVVTNHSIYQPHIEQIIQAYPDNVRLISISRNHAASTRLDSTVIHHGINVDEMPVGDGSGGYALFLGRMAHDKGVHRAVEIARKAGMPLKIAAKMREPGELAYFQKFVEPHLSADIEYVGEVGITQKLELLCGAVALLNPIQWPEPFGMVMIEALACGTPVVGCPQGAAPEIVDHGLTGFLDEDLDVLAVHLQSVDQLSRDRCRTQVKQRFSVERMVDRHVQIYREVAAARDASRRHRRELVATY